MAGADGSQRDRYAHISGTPLRVRLPADPHARSSVARQHPFLVSGSRAGAAVTSQGVEMRSRYLPLTIALTATMTVAPQTAIQGTDVVPGEGICTAPARQAMPDGAGHDHGDITQHGFRCQMR